MLLAGILGIIAFIKEPDFGLLLCSVIGFGFFIGWTLRNKMIHEK